MVLWPVSLCFKRTGSLRREVEDFISNTPACSIEDPALSSPFSLVSIRVRRIPLDLRLTDDSLLTASTVLQYRRIAVVAHAVRRIRSTVRLIQPCPDLICYSSRAPVTSKGRLRTDA